MFSTVDKFNEETYRLYFPDDQEVAEVSREEFKVIGSCLQSKTGQKKFW